MDVIVRFENPDNVNYKMMFYKGPRSRGIGKPVFHGETTVRDVQCGDVFCYKTFADGYYTYKKTFIINEQDIANGKKKIELSFEKRKSNGYEAESVNYWTDEVETKLVSGEYELNVDYKLDTPAFSEHKAKHEFSTTEECVAYIEKQCDDSVTARVYYLDAERKIPVVLITNEEKKDHESLQDIICRMRENHHLKVMYQAQIHGNEPAAGEAALYTIKYLSHSKEILQQMDIIIIPHVNPYGAERFVRFSDEQKMNLNRDSLILDSEITQKLREIYLALMPEVFIDAHEFCGPFNDMFDENNGNYLKMNDDIQVTCLNNLNRSQDIYVIEKEIIEDTLEKLKDKGLRCFCYRPGCDYSTSCGYTRIMNSLVFFIETNGIGRGKLYFERRVISQIEAMKLLLCHMVEKADTIKEVVSCARTQRPDKFVLKHDVSEDDVIWITRLSYDFFGNILGDQEKKVAYYNLGRQVKVMNYPNAYILDKRNKVAEIVKDILVKNGAIYEELPAGSKIKAECYKAWFGFGKKRWISSKVLKLKDGAYVFKTNQIASNVIVVSLEPEVEDMTKGNGIARPVDLFMKNCKEYPVYRIM